MTKRNPIHPGQLIKHDCIEALGLSVLGAAEALGVSRQTLHRVISGTGGVTPDLALRLSKVFGSTAETWLALQAKYDLAHIPVTGHIHLHRIKASRGHEAVSR